MIGKRIRFFRNRKGMTQKQLGKLLGFLGKTSDVRMAQYESETRIPKDNLVKEMAHILNVSPNAITVPNIDTYVGLMHTLFALEDVYGLKIKEIDGKICLQLDKSADISIQDMFFAWQEQSAKLEKGEISEEDYNQWRYKYPETDKSKQKAKVPSLELSDYIVDALKNKSK